MDSQILLRLGLMSRDVFDQPKAPESLSQALNPNPAFGYSERAASLSWKVAEARHW